MNSDTLKLTALAAIMADLMDQKGSGPIWSSLAKEFLRDLTTKRLNELMEHSFLKEAGGAGDLMLCVSITNKIASHNIKEVNNA
ncbi:phosphorylase b kinase gamma catalytic chain [Aspergillus affinis]|uniref:phosphorylase b kinase gamma catalytic chain n=1 Tax=Aspergillus affinis TaxID=1070780 RepID=UPI0022FE3B2F|nr:phosphorylase b kinase gamma catalytic chain [Aspergillus affinis]KAI9041325.1 phosphorylase b kinase gamma catalytic chain [Aspergillus affinis]